MEIKPLDILITDSLGFQLTVEIYVDAFEHLGQHNTHQDEFGKVPPDAVHRIEIQQGLSSETLNEVIPHEVYHMFYSIRPLITVDEETEAEVFGQLVKHIHNLLEPRGKILN